MEAFFLFVLANMTIFGDVAKDPINEAWKGRQYARQFECERMTQAEAHQKYPGRVPATSARGQVLFGVDALVCERMVAPPKMRTPRDELVLSHLDDDVAELTGLAAARVPPETKWVVDAYYPNPAIVRKVANASRMSLVERGRPVSDAAPRFTAGDVEVFRSLPMRDALPLACRRMRELGTLAEDEAFLSIALLHEKESQLHAGLCQGGTFEWLR